MTVALVMDFPGGTKHQYDEVVDRMGLNGQMVSGGVTHAAGSYEGGWRVIDVWEDLEHFERFRDEQIIPHTSAVGLAPPNVRVIEVAEDKGGNGQTPEIVQCVILPGLDQEAFRAADAQVSGDGMPPAITFHVNGPFEDGWIVIDGWSSKQERDEGIESKIKPAIESAPLTGPPRIEDLIVEATMTGTAAARA
jgi:hypothetical protein